MRWWFVLRIRFDVVAVFFCFLFFVLSRARISLFKAPQARSRTLNQSRFWTNEMDDDIEHEQNVKEETKKKKRRKTRNDILSNNAVLKFYVQIRWIEIKTAQHEAAASPTIHLSLARSLARSLSRPLDRCWTAWPHFFIPFWMHNVQVRRNEFLRWQRREMAAQPCAGLVGQKNQTKYRTVKIMWQFMWSAKTVA